MKVACQRDCLDGCFLILEGEGPEASVRGDPDHPVTKGFACPKALNFPSYYSSGRRVLYPHIRTENGFRRVSWDQALDVIASKLEEVMREYGPQEVLIFNYSGNTGLINFNYPLRLAYALNAYRVQYTICDEAGELALELHYGMRYGAFPEDLERAEMVVVWGANPASSSVHAYRILADLKVRGVPIWVIDPRKTKTSLLGNYVRIKPGTDSVLAASISWYLINEMGVDEGFISKYTVGFEEYARHISKYTPELVEEVTGVPKRTVRELAEEYARLKPSVTYIGVGMQKTKYGAEAVRIISLISALVGVHRGFFFCNSSRDFDTAYLQGRHLGEDRRVNMLDVPSMLSSGRFKFLYIYNSNPAVTLPRSDLFREGMGREDLFSVVHDVMWTETAELADVVLPATGMFEQEDFVASWWHPYLAYSPKAWEPLGESRPNWWVVQKLAEKLGIEAPELKEDPIQAFERAVRGSKMLRAPVEEVMRRGYVKLEYPPKHEYQTPSGRIEFFSSAAERLGYSPLPVVGWEEVDPDYPYILITSSVPERTSSQDTMPSDLLVRDHIYISRKDADRLGLKTGDLVLLRSPWAEAIATVAVDDSLPSGVLWARRSAKFIKGAVNDLLHDEKQVIAGGNSLNSSRVSIEVLVSEG